jgi:hypothetical protein
MRGWWIQGGQDDGMMDMLVWVQAEGRVGQPMAASTENSARRVLVAHPDELMAVQSLLDPPHNTISDG